MNDAEFRKRMGRNLQALRKEAGFKSARAFAEYLGMNTSTYTDYEQGRRACSLDRACEFADALGCSLDALANQDPIPPADNGTADV